MPFCFMNLRATRSGAGFEPDFPRGVDFLLLADLPELDWGVYEFDVKRDDDNWMPPDPAGDELAALIESGKRYPPALALARDELVMVFGEHRPTQDEFATAYASAIRSGLSRQPEVPFLLVQSLTDEPGYLSKGEWYWILRVTGTPPVACWVSDDYHVYKNPVTDFDLTGQQLRQLGS